MTDFAITVRDRTVTVDRRPSVVVSGSVNIYTMSVALDDAWDGYTCRAVFRCGLELREALIVDGACTVPWEALVANGSLYIGVYGINGDKRMPTCWTSERIYVAPGTVTADASQDPSPTVFEELVAQTAQDREAAEAAKLAAETARTGALTAEKNAGTYATNAGNSATAAAGSATNAQSAQTAAETARDAASSSKTAAATSETNAASSAAAASTSAGNASESATAASTSASNASTSANESASSASASASSASTADAAKTAAESAAQAAAAHDVVLQTGLTAVQQLAARSNIDAQKQAWETTSGYIATCTDANAGTCYPMIYGKSVQDGTPTPEAPVAVQSAQSPLSVEISQTFSNAYIIQDAIRNGTIKNYVSVGDFFTVGRGGTGWLFQVAAFDYDVPVDSRYTHSMRLLMYPVFANVPFDAPEAIYYAAAELAAGTHWFINNRTNKYYSFTTTQAIPVGGQAVPVFGASPDYAITQIKTYASQTSTTALETVTATISDTAPTIGIQLTPVNDDNRARWGSNNWMQSAIRQWLNSAATTGWWTPKNIYDRPQSSPTDGFLNGIDADLLDCIGKVRLRTGLNPVDNAGTFGYSDNEELIFLPSRTEMGLGNSVANIYETPVAADGIAKTDTLPLFKSNADRVKYLAGVAHVWWMRSPDSYATGANYTCIVTLTGARDSLSALNGFGAVPSCVIY